MLSQDRLREIDPVVKLSTEELEEIKAQEATRLARITQATTSLRRRSEDAGTKPNTHSKESHFTFSSLLAATGVTFAALSMLIATSRDAGGRMPVGTIVPTSPPPNPDARLQRPLTECLSEEDKQHCLDVLDDTQDRFEVIRDLLQSHLRKDESVQIYDLSVSVWIVMEDPNGVNPRTNLVSADSITFTPSGSPRAQTEKEGQEKIEKMIKTIDDAIQNLQYAKIQVGYGYSVRPIVANAGQYKKDGAMHTFSDETGPIPKFKKAVDSKGEQHWKLVSKDIAKDITPKK